uniref:non-specific serine/threonine protein kinase n=1 Tax=Hordeum vulgare subsp. vulgare TaxID=112509 RepID=F2CVZ7_HORVV|nr:predicted protein [Hordeum vulgare subsp. vulgare]
MPAEVHGASRMGGKEGLERRREGRRKKKQQHGRGGSTRSGSGSVVARLALDLERRKKKNQRAAALERDPLPFAAGSTLPQQEQGCARASSSWEGKTGDGLADEGEDRGGIGTWVGLPARGLSSKDHPRGHQVIRHPSQRQLRSSVADFGLARLAENEVTHVSMRVMGTFGYLVPEYASTGKLTEKSDVFSFGVVLLELITGRKPVDTSRPLGDESLVEWSRPLLNRAIDEQEFEELVDPCLTGDYDDVEMFRMIEAAVACIRHSAARRPKMGQVVRILDSLTLNDVDLSNGGRRDL